MRSDDNQPKQYDENSQMTNTEGLYMCGILCSVTLCAWYIWW